LGCENDSERTISLDWEYKALGRYQQRTVFTIAPEARFRVLFGPENNENGQTQQPDLFENRIKSGELKTEIPKISFQQGIEEGIMQRVALASASVAELEEEEPAAQIFSLAELEPQLDADTGQYYHLDKKTNNKTWNSPTSTLGSTL
jgi:hypothetical protein